ncbi:8600_t:CDS:2 [Gigaspora margarita]|uniref:8600_t:CDS:1 n=1 Tax=Gigaspora margarita TaxID=4874 RepID=A0ABN7WVR9_GIGMA|nr:8600_t:CDS:2 [Gigaspora margarita]
MVKKIITSKKIGTGFRAIDVSELERMRKPGYRRINKGLLPDATPLDKAKHEIQQNILRYKRKQGLSEKEIKQKLGIKQEKLEYLLFGHIEKFSLDEMVNYASELIPPFELKVISDLPYSSAKINETPSITKMTNEQDQNLQDYARKLAGKIAVDAALDPNVYSKIYQGLKTGAKEGAKFALNTGVNLIAEPKKALHTAIGLAERAVSSIPLIGKALSFGLGTAKDALLDAKLETLSKNIQGLKDGLENLANSTAQALDGLRGEMEEALGELGARQDQLEQFTKAFQAKQENVNQQVQKNIENINENLKEHEKKINDNAQKIFKEQIKLEDVRSEFKDQIRITNTNLDNLRKEQEETKHDFEKYKHQINEKTVKTEQAFEDLQSDYTRRNKIIETQIKDNEEQLGEFQENLANVEFQQKKLNLEHQEFAESLEEQINLSYEQRKRLDLVVNEIEDIQEEFNTKINRLQQSQLDQDEKIDEAVFVAKRATRKVEEISDKLEKHNQKIDKLREHVEKNKQDIQQAKHEAQRANERIDNLLKTQKLLDHTKEIQAFNKIQKTLQLKAEEAQLLASLELLKKTQKLITQPSERE